MRSSRSTGRESRVCEHCRLGLILTAGDELVPAEREPFLVVDELMRVRAVSKRAERLLGITETAAVNQHLGDFLVPVEGGAEPTGRLAAVIAAASNLDSPVQHVVLRPRDAFGVRFGVRLGGCAPGPAALLVLAQGL
jgi:PAS domain-containing protein